MSAATRCCWCATAAQSPPSPRLHPLSRAARRRAVRRRHRALPWHHACFELATGEALRAPAIDPLSCWPVEQRDGRIFVGAKQAPPAPKPTGTPSVRIVILGGGAAGFAAAKSCAVAGYDGVDRDAQRGRARRPSTGPTSPRIIWRASAPEDWMPLRPDEFYAENDIDLRAEDRRRRDRRQGARRCRRRRQRARL